MLLHAGLPAVAHQQMQQQSQLQLQQQSQLQLQQQQQTTVASHTLHLRVLYEDETGRVRRVSVDVVYSRTTEALSFKGYGAPRGVVETDPSLWKSFIITEVLMDCTNTRIVCAFVDGEAALLVMPPACLRRLHDILGEYGLLGSSGNGSGGSGGSSSGGTAATGMTLSPYMRGDILDVYVRFVLAELDLPASYALWMAESALLKQERRIKNIDDELDRQAQLAQTIKIRMKHMRERFARLLYADSSGYIRRCGPVYLEMVWEGFETDIVEYNKTMTLLQSQVDRLKEQLAASPTEVASPHANVSSAVGGYATHTDGKSSISTPISTPISNTSSPTAVLSPTSATFTDAALSLFSSKTAKNASAPGHQRNSSLGGAPSAAGGSGSNSSSSSSSSEGKLSYAIATGGFAPLGMRVSASSDSLLSPVTAVANLSIHPSPPQSAVTSGPPSPISGAAGGISLTSTTVLPLTLKEQLDLKRRERDTAWELVTMHIEAREKCKAELRARKSDDDRAVAALVSSQEGEHEYITLHRQLREVRTQRNFLSQDKLMAVNAREVSKAEIRQLKETQAALNRRMQIEVTKKRKLKKQSWQSGRFVE